jgi:hypothetical protein
MKKTIPQRIEALNAHRLTTYFAILGLEPIAIREHATDYISPLGKNRAAVLTVDHDSNSFTDRTNRKKGHLVDFICAWWQVTPKEIFRDIVPYQLYLLYHETENEKAARP